jgi:hypothetical protein
MCEREPKCDAIKMAKRRDLCGRATADEISRSSRAGRWRSSWRNVAPFLGSLTLAGLFVAVIPLPVRADNDEGSRHGREDDDKGIRSEIMALRATVSELQGQINALKTANAELQSEINTVRTSSSTLQSQLAGIQANPVLALGPFVSVDLGGENDVSGPNIIFTSANVHIVSGSNSTYNSNGLGNLIIGYDQMPNDAGPGGPHLRMGSHNLVIGDGHRFNGSGGMVAGVLNTIDGQGATITGGEGNTSNGLYSTVSGGVGNTASGGAASVSGGGSNTASGSLSSVAGGVNNTASGEFANLSGGESNNSTGFAANISGGSGNRAGGKDTIVIGGINVADDKDSSIAPQPPFP